MLVNTQKYWDDRFLSEDWSNKGGHIQSYNHASRFIPCLQIPSSFSGTICDFGCAEGDAFPLYRRSWPKATLKGVDFSEEALKKARLKYGSIAIFQQGDYRDVGPCDLIICAHTIEHIVNHYDVIRHFTEISKCVFIIVPYREDPIGKEHLRTYDETSYRDLNPRRYVVLDAGWQYRGLSLLYNVYIKNTIRPIFGKRLVKCPKQIMFEFRAS